MPHDQEQLISSPSFSQQWQLQAFTQLREHPFTTTGFILAGLALLGLLLQSLWQIGSGEASQSARFALMGGTISFLATALGALPALLLRNISQSVEDSMMGFAAGMMLAAAVFSLIVPGIDAGVNLTDSKSLGVGLVCIGIFIGVLVMLGLDQLVPHEHDKTGPCGPAHENCHRMLLFVFAIALHNLPEGMAIGVGFAASDMSVGVPLTAAISIQNLPEGLAVALVMISAGFRSSLSVVVAAASALFEPIGAILGVGLASGMAAAYPIGLGLAGGAMLFVVSHEVIPETHRNGHQTLATLGLMAGFVLMMVLDTVLV